MSYHVTNQFAGLGADPGCTAVPYVGTDGASLVGQICPTGPVTGTCGMQTGVLRAVLENLGYHCDRSDCRKSLMNFRTDKRLPQDAGYRGDIIITDCQPLHAAYTALMGRQQQPPPPTPLPTTGGSTPKILSSSQRRIAATMSSPAAKLSASQPASSAEPEKVVGFWEARSTVEKGLIIAGGVAVVGAIGFAFTR